MIGSRLLVAVSSPWASQKLSMPIVELAKRLEAEALIAHVARPQNEDEDDSDAKQRGEETLKLLTDPLRNAGVKADAIMLFSDDVPKAILNTANARDCTMIVMGLTSKSMWKRLVNGDIPKHIQRTSNLPVLLCPATWTGVI